MAKVTAIILAAGVSRRMGSANKLLLPWRETTLIDWVIGQLSPIEFEEMVIVSSELTQTHLAKYGDDFTQVCNQDYLSGMTSSIQAGIRAAQRATDGFMICLGDQPGITTEQYQSIINAFSEEVSKGGQPITVPFFNQKKGNPVIFHRAYQSAILSHPFPEGCKEIIQENRAHIRKIDLEESTILADIDTPEDYEALKNRFDDSAQ